MRPDYFGSSSAMTDTLKLTLAEVLSEEFISPIINLCTGIEVMSAHFDCDSVW